MGIKANMLTKTLARTALLLALTLTFQSLRLVIPLPVFSSTLVIGSLVNACLLVAVETVGMMPMIIIAVIAPIVAFFQQLLPVPLFILPVAAANVMYGLVYMLGLKWGRIQGILMAAAIKSLFLFVSFSWMLTLIALPAKLAMAVMFVMSWPQLITTVLGGILAGLIIRRLKIIKQ